MTDSTNTRISSSSTAAATITTYRPGISSGISPRAKGPVTARSFASSRTVNGSPASSSPSRSGPVQPLSDLAVLRARLAAAQSGNHAASASNGTTQHAPPAAVRLITNKNSNFAIERGTGNNPNTSSTNRPSYLVGRAQPATLNHHPPSTASSLLAKNQNVTSAAEALLRQFDASASSSPKASPQGSPSRLRQRVSPTGSPAASPRAAGKPAVPSTSGTESFASRFSIAAPVSSVRNRASTGQAPAGSSSRIGSSLPTSSVLESLKQRAREDASRALNREDTPLSRARASMRELRAQGESAANTATSSSPSTTPSLKPIPRQFAPKHTLARTPIRPAQPPASTSIVGGESKEQLEEQPESEPTAAPSPLIQSKGSPEHRPVVESDDDSHAHSRAGSDASSDQQQHERKYSTSSADGLPSNLSIVTSHAAASASSLYAPARTRLERFLSVPETSTVGPYGSSSSPGLVGSSSHPNGLNHHSSLSHSASAPNSPPFQSHPSSPGSPLYLPGRYAQAPPPPREVDVVIIGAGLSGLTAATTLVELGGKGLSIQVVEGSERVGGRTLTRHVSLTLPSPSPSADSDEAASAAVVPPPQRTANIQIDLGGQWIGASHQALRDLAKKWQMKITPQYHSGTKLAMVNGEVKSYNGEIPSYLSYWDLIKLQLLMWRLDRLASQVPADDCTASPYAKVWDSQTVESWSEKNVSSLALRSLISSTVRGLFGCEAGEISMLFFLSYIASNGGHIEPLVSIPNGFQQDIFSSGSQTLSEKMALSFGMGEYQNVGLSLLSPVQTIWRETPFSEICQEEIDEGLDRLVVQSTNGATLHARAVILACPPSSIRHLSIHPRLPPAREHFISTSRMGRIIKAVLLYETAWWRSNGGFSGECFSDYSPSASTEDSGPIFQLYDGSKVLQGKDSPINNHSDGHEEQIQPGLIVFINGQAAVDWSSRSPEERQHAILLQLHRIFPSIPEEQISSPLFYDEMDWAAQTDPHLIGGAPVSCYAPGSLWASGGSKALRQNIGKLFFAGTESARHSTGFMNGAVIAGQDAAHAVLKVLKREGVIEGGEVQEQDESEQQQLVKSDDNEVDEREECFTRNYEQLDPDEPFFTCTHWIIFLLLTLFSITLLILDSSQCDALVEWISSTLMRLQRDYAQPSMQFLYYHLTHYSKHIIRVWQSSGAQAWIDVLLDSALALQTRGQQTNTKPAAGS